MTLTTHAVAGGLIGAVAYQNPAAGALFGFVSHFLLDSIPHWDYHLDSAHEDELQPLNNDMDVHSRAFVTDLVKIGCDILLGLAIVFFIFYPENLSVVVGALVGAAFAIIPDGLQFIYMKTRQGPILVLQKFHIYISAKIKLNKQPLLGISTQLALVVLMIIASYWLRLHI